jgi:amphiphysin
MQRSFGKLLHKGPGDNAKVSVLLNDYEDADKVFAKVWCVA